MVETFTYDVFGGVLESTLVFPELADSAAVATPDFRLRQVATLPTAEGWSPCGTSPVETGVECRLFRSPDGGRYRLEFDDTGVFEVGAEGRSVDWCPPDGVDVVRARKDVLGRVFALVFHQRGIPTLHGSAVTLEGAGLCFLAPKLHGKSTTAAALVDAGGTLLADDLVVVDAEQNPPLLRPTLPTLHLWPDSAEHVGREARAVDPEDEQTKVQMRWAPGRGFERSAIPLQGIYLLVPVEADGAEVRRSLLPPGAAAMALLGQMKVADLLGPMGVFDLLPVASRLAEDVGVHRLEVPRDLTRLSEVVDALRGWHGLSEAPR